MLFCPRLYQNIFFDTYKLFRSDKFFKVLCSRRTNFILQPGSTWASKPMQNIIFHVFRASLRDTALDDLTPLTFWFLVEVHVKISNYWDREWTFELLGELNFTLVTR